MGFTYKGLDCLKDMDLDEYAALKKISQAGKNAWAYQANYAHYVSYFGAVLLFLLITKKLLYKYSDYQYRNSGITGGKFQVPITGKLAAFGRFVSYRRLPVIISRVTGLPPSLGTLLLFTASTVFVMGYCFGPRPYLRGCAGFGSPPLSVRSGMMVMSMTPFLYILSGKTNFVSWVTGISYEKVNIFHQYLGWASLALSWIHTVPFFVQANREGGAARVHAKWESEELWRNGVPPLIFLTFLCFGFTRFARRWLYEAFWHLHWILGIGYFIGLTYHVYGSLGSEKYMWGTLAFWGFQMLYRVLVKSTFKPTTYSFKHKRATLKVVTDELFEVFIPISSIYEFDWAPGQHVFIRFVHGIRTVDNHPFSIMTIPSIDQRNYNLKLLVKPKKGFTRTLYEDLLREKDAKSYDVFIDGPYGGMNRDSLAFDKLFLVATGTGITVILPFLQHVAQNSMDPSNLVKSVELHWVVSSLDSLKWIEDELRDTYQVIKKMAPKFLDNVSFNVYVTNSNPEGKTTVVVDEKHCSSDADSSCSNFDFDYRQYLTIHDNTKPNLANTFETPVLGNRNAFIVSGSVSAQADVGNAVAKLQSQVWRGDLQEVYLHMENFSW